MSYNIDTWRRVRGGPLRISKINAEKLMQRFDDERPEGWFLDGLRFNEEGYAEIRGSLVRSGGSSHFYTKHIDEVVACLEGEADFVLTWEGGDSFTGLRIAGGKAVEMDVMMHLEPRP